MFNAQVLIQAASEDAGAGNGGSTTIAWVGAITGVLALLWNWWRTIRDGPRLHLAFSLYRAYAGDPEVDPSPPFEERALVSFTNSGTVPAYVDSVGFAKRLPWDYRVPVVRRLSYRTRRRWLTHLFLERSRVTRRRNPLQDTDYPLIVRPGEAVRRHVDISSDRVHEFADEYRWVVAETGLGKVIGHVLDNRQS